MPIRYEVNKLFLSIFCLGVILLFFVFLPGYSHAIGDVGVVVERAEVEKGDTVIACKYCGKTIQVGNIHSDAEKIVAERLQEALSARGFGFGSVEDKKPFIKVVIFRFQERKGGSFAVDKPAGVGFHMHLMQGNVVGRTYVFDEDQQPLSQNVLGIGKFLKRGAKWITVEELAAEGINTGLDYILEILQ